MRGWMAILLEHSARSRGVMGLIPLLPSFFPQFLQKKLKEIRPAQIAAGGVRCRRLLAKMPYNGRLHRQIGFAPVCIIFR